MKTWSVVLLTSTALLPAVASAQTGTTESGVAQTAPQAAPEEGPLPGDIIVTAQRYQQRLQDVPLSLSVVGSDEIRARSASDIGDLQYSVPGLSLYEYGPGKPFIQMRGLSNTIGASTVGIYLDETPLSLDAQGDGFPVRLIDMERVEVLRGPQATLYGEGSMGGTIRYIPAAPKFDAISGSVEAEYNSVKDGGNGYKAIGALNLPLSDKIALRVAGGYERIGGYIDNVVLDRKDVNRADLYTIRGILLAKPSDRLSVSIMALHQKSTHDNQDFGVDRETTAGILAYNKDRATLIQGKFDYEADFANLAGSISYIDRKNRSLSDLSPFYVPVLSAPPPFGFGLPEGFITQVSLASRIKYNILNTELRLASQPESALGWSLGASYRELKSDSFSDAPTAPGTIDLAILELDQKTRIKYVTVYGEINFAVTPKLKAAAGVRYFHERKKQDSISTNFGLTTIDLNKGTFETVNPRVNLSYEFTPNSMVFASVAKGFRGGGFNLQSAGGGVYAIPPTYAPDEIWTYELGTKHQLFGNRLILDASVYRSEWSKVQSYTFAPGSPLTVVTNSGDVSGWGVDLSATVRPIRALTLSATYSWNNLAFDNATADKLPGDPVDGAVRETYSASLDYRPPLTDSITGLFRVDYQHAGKAQLTLRNFGGQIVPRPSRDLVNVRVGATVGPVEVALFADNLFDEDAPNIIGPFGVFTEDLEQRPRTIGISARATF